MNGPARLNVNDPADAQKLVNTGLAWRSGPATLQVLFRLIQSGEVTRVPEKETPQVRAYLDKLTASQQDEAEAQDVLEVEEANAQDEPVEQPDVTPAEPPIA